MRARRMFLIAVLGALAAGLGAPAALAEGPAPTVLLGSLSEQWARVCAGGQEAWTNPHFEAGFVWLLPEPGVDLRPLLGKPVLLTGAPAERPLEGGAQNAGECPQQQARSDFVFGRDGIRLRRELPEGAARAAAFKVTRAQELAGFSVVRQGDKLVARFENGLPFALTGAALVLHYEGCYGKPGAPAEERRLERLEPGAAATAAFPTLITIDHQREGKWVPRGRMVHVPASLQLTTTMPGLIVDLDLPLARFEGAAVPCPARE